MRFLVIAAVTIMCFGFIVEAHFPVIPDKLLGKLAPPLLFLGGAYGTAAVGAVVGASLAKQKRHGGHHGGMHMGGLFAVHPGFQFGHVAPLNHQI